MKKAPLNDTDRKKLDKLENKLKHEEHIQKLWKSVMELVNEKDKDLAEDVLDVYEAIIRKDEREIIEKEKKSMKHFVDNAVKPFDLLSEFIKLINLIDDVGGEFEENERDKGLKDEYIKSIIIWYGAKNIEEIPHNIFHLLLDRFYDAAKKYKIKYKTNFYKD